MRSTMTLAIAVAIVAAAPALRDMDAALSHRQSTLILAEASGPSPHGHDTAVMAETESNHSSPGGRDSAQLV